jgi:regulator of protease activity HflC (stomatin/prohibitin superfamily)
VSQAIADGNLQAINYFIAQRYIDALGAYARSPGEKVLFLPLEATNIVGTVSGVAALAEGARTQRGGEG